jgi:glycosyltransferase involved in cell wall biosynthesis
MRIAWVVPGIERDRFSAGMLCILKLAHGLAERGHDVAVIPSGTGEIPDWISGPARIERHVPSTRDAGRALTRALRARLGGSAGDEAAEKLDDVVRALAPYAASDTLRRGAELDRMRRVLPDADVTIATASTTVVPVHLYGHGRRVHFVQNYEPWFADDFRDPVFARAEAELAYALPLERIANVGWLAEMVGGEGDELPVVHGAVDHSVFFPEGEAVADPFTVVSYGGRDATWKGFADGVEAIALAREQIPGLRWLVFGGALLPADNGIAPYEDRGFVTGPELRRLYCEGSVVLCPSWFEGFPYPPLEAMACGRPVIATPRGAGDIARDGENAVLVPERDPAAMAAALVELARDPARRARLAEQGRADAAAYTWERSTERMEEILSALVQGDAS